MRHIKASFRMLMILTLLLVSIVPMIVTTNPGTVYADAGWLGNYSYRQEIVTTGTTEGNLTDYQMGLRLYMGDIPASSNAAQGFSFLERWQVDNPLPCCAQGIFSNGTHLYLTLGSAVATGGRILVYEEDGTLIDSRTDPHLDGLDVDQVNNLWIKDDKLYVCAANKWSPFNSHIKVYWAYDGDGHSRLDYIEEYPKGASSGAWYNDPWMLEAITYHDDYWWLTYGTWTDPPHITRYNDEFEEGVDYPTEIGYNGLAWIGDHLIGSIHESVPGYNVAHVYEFTGTEFILVEPLVRPSSACGQGISTDPDEVDVMWWMERTGYGTDDAYVVKTTIEYSLLLHVSLNNHVQNDFDDVAFTTSDGVTEIYHWLETGSLDYGETADVWVLFDTILASPDTSTFYMYYGLEGGASEYRSGEDTFPEFFDEMDVAPGDDANWTQTLVSGGTITANEGIATFHLSTSSGSKAQAFTDTEWTGGAVRARVKTPALAENVYHHVGFGDDPPGSSYAGYCWKENIEFKAWARAGNGKTESIKTVPPANTWFTYDVLWTDDDVARYYYDDYWIERLTTSVPTVPLSLVLTHEVDGTAAATSDTYVDWILYRELVDPAPYWRIWGTEEEGGNPPTVTTQAIADITNTTATGHGTIVALDGRNCTIRGFEWDTDTGAPYAYNVTEEGDYGTGAYDDSLEGLPGGTTIYYRAMAYATEAGGWGYGNEVTFATTGGATPTVSTSTVAELSTTGATLQGVLTSLGDYTPIYVFFEYGLTTSYGTTTLEQTKTATGGFNQAITGLSPSTLYHWRAMARHGADSYVYGSDATFTTATSGTPVVVTSEAIGVDETTATLQGTLNSLGDYSPVYVYFQYSEVEGEELTATTEETKTSTETFNFPISGLSSDTTYYYRAVVRYNGSNRIYGSYVSFTTERVGEGILPAPIYIWLGTALVFESYQVTGSQLIVFEYMLSYSTEPSQDASDFFVFEIWDGADIISSSPVIAWGHKPGSVYLSPFNTLTWGQAFTLKLTGIPSQWGESIPERTYSVSPSNWAYDRDNFDQLDRWVFTVAEGINTDWVVFSTAGDRLSDEACLVFNRAIGGLSSVRAEICISGFIYPDDEPPVFDDAGQEQMTRERNLGDYINGLLDDAGDVMGVDGDTAGTMLMAFMCLTLLIGIGAITRNPAYSLIAIVPLIAFGNYIGLIGLIFTLTVAALLILYFYSVMWLRGI